MGKKQLTCTDYIADTTNGLTKPNVNLQKNNNFTVPKGAVFLCPKPIGERKIKMKIFISQPMRGKTDTEITKERNKTISTAKELYGEDVEVIDSFFQSAPTDAKPLWFLGKSLELLSGADVAVFCPGWEDARGCRIEHDCCVEYGIECLHL